MVAQDLTKFTLVIVLLGGVLAMAVFRPQILSSPPVESDEDEPQNEAASTVSNPGPGVDEEDTLFPGDLPAGQQEPEARQAALDELEAELKEWEAFLQAWEDRLVEEEGLLGQKENEVAEQWASIQVQQADVTAAWEDLHAEQARLVQEQESLQAERARLDQGWEDLQAQRARIDGEWAALRETQERLQAQGAILTAREQRLEGRERLSTAALVVSGLLAVPSMLVLVALTRQDVQGVDKKDRPSQASQTQRNKWLALSGRLRKESQASPHSGNGRNKESVPNRA